MHGGPRKGWERRSPAAAKIPPLPRPVKAAAHSADCHSAGQRVEVGGPGSDRPFSFSSGEAGLRLRSASPPDSHFFPSGVRAALQERQGNKTRSGGRVSRVRGGAYLVQSEHLPGVPPSIPSNRHGRVKNQRRLGHKLAIPPGHHFAQGALAIYQPGIRSSRRGNAPSDPAAETVLLLLASAPLLPLSCPTSRPDTVRRGECSAFSTCFLGPFRKTRPP